MKGNFFDHEGHEEHEDFFYHRVTELSGRKIIQNTNSAIQTLCHCASVVKKASCSLCSSGAPRGAHYLVDESSTKTRATQLILYRVLKPGGNNMV